jgi:hypothetical protein
MAPAGLQALDSRHLRAVALGRADRIRDRLGEVAAGVLPLEPASVREGQAQPEASRLRRSGSRRPAQDWLQQGDQHAHHGEGAEHPVVAGLADLRPAGDGRHQGQDRDDGDPHRIETLDRPRIRIAQPGRRRRGLRPGSRERRDRQCRLPQVQRVVVPVAPEEDERQHQAERGQAEDGPGEERSAATVEQHAGREGEQAEERHRAGRAEDAAGRVVELAEQEEADRERRRRAHRRHQCEQEDPPS